MKQEETKTEEIEAGEKPVGEKPCIRLCRKDENGKLVPVGALWLKAAKPDAKVKAFYVGYVGNFGRQDIVAFDN